jgi:hypothetical protein
MMPTSNPPAMGAAAVGTPALDVVVAAAPPGVTVGPVAALPLPVAAGPRPAVAVQRLETVLVIKALAALLSQILGMHDLFAQRHASD